MITKPPRANCSSSLKLLKEVQISFVKFTVAGKHFVVPLLITILYCTRTI